MATYKDYLEIERAVTLADGRVNEERELMKTIAACEAYFKKKGIDWDAEYGRAVAGQESRIEKLRHAKEVLLPAKRKEIADILRPIHKKAMALWSESHEGRKEDAPPEARRAAGRIDSLTTWIYETLVRVLPPEEVGAVMEEAHLTDADIEAVFKATRILSPSPEDGYKCRLCGGPGEVVKSPRRSLTTGELMDWQAWIQCLDENCARHDSSGGDFLKQDGLDMDALRIKERTETPRAMPRQADLWEEALV